MPKEYLIEKAKVFKLIVITVLLFSQNPLFSQYVERSDSAYAKDLIQRSRAQNLGGGVLMATGFIVLTGTAISALGTATQNFISTAVGGQPEKKSYALPLVIGIATSVGGIALVSEASNNKKLARRLSAYIKAEDVDRVSPKIIRDKYAAIAIKLSF